MTRAVIVSTARTPLAKSWKGAFNMTHGATLGGHVVKAAVERAGIEPGGGRGRADGLRQPRGRDRLQHRAPDRAARRLACHRAGHDDQPLLLERACRPSRMAAQRIIAGEGDVLRGRRRRKHLLRAERDEPAHVAAIPGWPSTSPRSTGTCCRPPRRWPSATASSKRAHGRIRRRAASKRPAPRRTAGLFKDEIAPITVTAGVADAQARPAQQGGHGQRRRGPAPRHDLRSHQGHPHRRCPAAWSLPAMPASSATAPAPAWWSARPTRRRRA